MGSFRNLVVLAAMAWLASAAIMLIATPADAQINYPESDLCAENPDFERCQPGFEIPICEQPEYADLAGCQEQIPLCVEHPDWEICGGTGETTTVGDDTNAPTPATKPRTTTAPATDEEIREAEDFLDELAGPITDADDELPITYAERIAALEESEIGGPCDPRVLASLNGEIERREEEEFSARETLPSLRSRQTELAAEVEQFLLPIKPLLDRIDLLSFTIRDIEEDARRNERGQMGPGTLDRVFRLQAEIRDLKARTRVALTNSEQQKRIDLAYLGPSITELENVIFRADRDFPIMYYQRDAVARTLAACD